MNGNLRVGSLFGIPFYINPSWFLVLGLVTWSYGSSLSLQFPQLGALAWLFGLITALLLFASVLAHELGHSFVAMRQGIPVNSITLFIFGGIASLAEESKTPGDAFWVAIAGPLVSFVLFGTLTAFSLFTNVAGPLAAILGLLSYINLALGTFNLIPGLPLDGGNILKAVVWKLTGKPYKGLAFASRVGQFFGWVGIGLGTASLLGLSQVGSIWTAMIGVFLLQNAGMSAQVATLQEKLSGLTAADAILPNSPVVSGEISLREFANNYIIGSDHRWRKYLVTDENGRLSGEIVVDDLKQIPTSDWWTVQVNALMHPVDTTLAIAATTPLLEVVQTLEGENLAALAVVREDGVLLGLLEKESIIQRLATSNQEAPVASSPSPDEEMNA